MKNEEQAQPQIVADRKAEIGISLSVYIQGLLLIATIGFGSSIVNSINTLTTAVSSLVTVTTVNSMEIKHLENGVKTNALNIESLRNGRLGK